jgi:large subunit ribosomal protein L2
MKLIKQKPVTNGSRHLLKLEKSSLLKNDKIFNNRKSKRYCSGRSPITGHITAWHRGSGHKKLYRKVNFSNENKFSIVLGVSYDPNRSAFVSNNFDLEKLKFFNTISTSYIYPGSLIKQNCTFKNVKYNLKNQNMLGYRTQLQNIPVGTIINNISSTDLSNGKFARSAGAKAQLIRSDKKNALVKLPSNDVIEISKKSCATIGIVSNDKHNLINYGKAGRKRNLNRRPIVRGIAMNPVDHPHGGRTNGGRPSVTPWGLPTKCKFRLRKKK